MFGVAFVGAKTHAPGHAKGKAKPLGAPSSFERAVKRSALAERPDRPAGQPPPVVQLDVVSTEAVQRFRAMGCDVAVAGGDPGAVAAVLERWEAAFSLFRPESELSRVNGRPRVSLVVSPLFARALEVALDDGRETEGLVDPTLCGRWPEVVRLGRLLSRPPGLALDLNGVVKALAVDAAAATLDGARLRLGRRRPRRARPGGRGAPRRRRDPRRRGRPRDERHGVARRAPRGHRDGRAERVALGAGHGVRRELPRRRRRGEGRLPARRRGPAWLDERGIPGRFVALDGEIVENDAWAGATPAVPACT